MYFKKRYIFISFIFITLFSLFTLSANESENNIKTDLSFLNDYIHKDYTITEEEFKNAFLNSKGWIGPGRGAINSAIGGFSKGDTVEVYSLDGEYQGTFNVFAESHVDNKTGNISYKLLMPLFIPYNTDLPLRIGYSVKKKFALSINTLYSGLFSRTYNTVHGVDILISFPKVFQPVALTFGPLIYFVSKSDILFGGSVGVFYRLPLDYMVKIITNLNFTFAFRFVMATSLKGGDKFNYGYSWDIGARWYFTKFMGVSFSFNMAGLFKSSNSSAVFNNLGFNTGICIEI